MKPLPWLSPITPLYAAAVRAKNFAYEHGQLRQKKLSAPVVSIGNLSTGGGGKTPFVIALAHLLTQTGIAVDVLSRGYGRTSDAVTRVDASSQSTAEEFGDEPLLIARSANVPVFLGRSRYAAGLLAERDTSPLVHLLDDGFQHRQLARNLDIVLIHRDDLTARLLPAGPLREPLSSLARAHVIVLREQDRILERQLRAFLRADASIWHIHRTVILPSRSGPAVAFCGIARPEDFFASIADQRVPVLATLAFPDHHRYSERDLDRICLQVSHGATHFLTTEKDLARLSPQALQKLQQCAPVEVVRLRVRIVEADAAVNLIRRL